MRRRLLLTASFGLLGLAACEPAMPPTTSVIEIGTQEATAIIESVDRNKREVLLRGPEGRLLTMRASGSVRNFDQLRAGQRVVVRYDVAVAAWIAPASAGGANATVVVGAERAAQGQRPQGAVGAMVHVQVIVESVDVAANTVTFLGPLGVARTVFVRDPTMQQMLPTLKTGDRIDVLYDEALALSVEPMGS